MTQNSNIEMVGESVGQKSRTQYDCVKTNESNHRNKFLFRQVTYLFHFDLLFLIKFMLFIFDNKLCIISL